MVRSGGMALAILATVAAAHAEIPSPEEVFGHPIGADRKLVPYRQVLDYLETVAAASDRVSIELAGESTHGEPMPVVVLTSAAQQAKLERHREIARQLARPHGLSEAEIAALVDEGRTIALVTCTIHATEVGCTQMATEFVHAFATTDDEDRVAWMDDAILLLMPSINPDGQVLVIDWYQRWLGTEYEGGRMPWLYHEYVGHDNNRDFYMLTQKETRVVNEVLYHRWFPQVFLDEHQMGSTGPRMFVPPQADPLAPEVHSLIFRQADLLGTNMSRRLEESGKRGVGHNMIFDSYWPGGTRNTAWWKNVTGLLTEVASVRIATPIRIERGELRGGYKGLPEYTRRANYPSPWEGGWWRLRDVVEYELVATWAFLESCAENRKDILRNVATMARESIERGRSEPPYGFVVPPEQHDPVAAADLVDLLILHGVEVTVAAEPLAAGYATYPAGTVVIPASQPYRPFLLTMLRPQRYPEVRADADGPIIPPYDVTSWSLPISMGVEVVELTTPTSTGLTPIDAAPRREPKPLPEASGYWLSHRADSVYTATNRMLAAGARVHWLDDPADRRGVWVEGVSAETLATGIADLGLVAEAGDLACRVDGTPTPRHRTFDGAPRVGLYKPWVASKDEGWTRWLLERYEFPYVSLRNAAIRSGTFADEVDVLLLPDVDASILARGEPEGDERRRFWSPLPPPYAGGLDSEDDGGSEEGGDQIERWVREGGTVVALDSSTEYLIERLGLPVSDVLDGLSRDRIDGPGSMLRIELDTDHWLTFGLRAEEAAYFARSPAFQTRVPDARFRRHVVARYPKDDDDILISGYLKGADQLADRAAVVEIEMGAGRVILIGFRAQHRAQTHRTFKLLWNALYTAVDRTARPTSGCPER